MKKNLAIILMLFINASFVIAKDKSNIDTFPQAKPVRQQLIAVKTGNIQLLKDSYSKRLQERFVQEYKSWDEILKLYDEAMNKAFPNYKVSDFSFDYRTVDNEFGVVFFKYKGKLVEKAEKRVVLENGIWKVAEK